MGNIVIENINVSYGDNLIYSNFHIDIDIGKINCIMGHSGCGKTTLLNYLCHYFIGKGRLVSYIFQEDRLIPWKTVKENLELICKGPNESNFYVENLLQELNLYKYRNYYPNQLSGGMKQRVNIARALIYKSEIIIMDESFKSIDENNKKIIMDIIEKNNLFNNVTVIMVTHNKEEALKLSDKIIILGESPVNIIKQYYNEKKHYQAYQ
jgi:NitT/TauT family transport system ATP-binding protein